MAYIADQLFPPIATIEESAEFSNFNYWREPVFQLDDLLPADALDGAAGPAAVASNVSLIGAAVGNAEPVATTVGTTAIALAATSAAPDNAANQSAVQKASSGANSAQNSPSTHSKALPTILEQH